MFRRFICACIIIFMLVLPVSASGIDGDLTGGYYFVCDCTFGDDIKFYVPVEWAHDAFSIDSSGALVNLSTSTCYAYCPNYPDYTFYCSRLNTFVYRRDSSTIYDLEVTKVTDTNMSLLQDSSVYLSDKEINLLGAALLFVACALIIIRRR